MEVWSVGVRHRMESWQEAWIVLGWSLGVGHRMESWGGGMECLEVGHGM